VLWRDAGTGNNDILFRRGGPAGTAASTAAGPVVPALQAFPNPSRGGTVRFARADGAAAGTLEIASAAGRIVRRLPGGAAWDGRSSDGAPVAAGVYFVRSRGEATVRITVLR
jgi:hypothetical protein